MTRRTIVTGGSSGIGAALARLAHSEGDDVLVVARRAGDVGRSLQADLSTHDGWDAFASATTHEFDGADRVECWHVAGTLHPVGSVGEVDAGAYRQNVLLNAAAPMIVGDAFIRAARATATPALFVAVSSGAASTPYPGWSSYGAGKAAIEQWVRTVAAEQDDQDAIRVLAIAPGVVDTPMQQQIRATDVTDFPRRERFVELHESGRLADPDDVAHRLRRAAHGLANGSVVDLRSL